MPPELRGDFLRQVVAILGPPCVGVGDLEHDPAMPLQQVAEDCMAVALRSWWRQSVPWIPRRVDRASRSMIRSGENGHAARVVQDAATTRISMSSPGPAGRRGSWRFLRSSRTPSTKRRCWRSTGCRRPLAGIYRPASFSSWFEFGEVAVEDSKSMVCMRACIPSARGRCRLLSPDPGETRCSPTPPGHQDLPKAAAFYDEVLGVLGARRFMEEPDYFIAWGDLETGAGSASLSVRQADRQRRRAVPWWRCRGDSRAWMDAVRTGAGAWRHRRGAPPGKRWPGFYAAYFRDLDGNKSSAATLGE